MFSRLLRGIFSSPLYIFFLLLLISFHNTGHSQTKKRGSLKEDSIIAFKDRWSFKTNSLGWLMTIPNVGVEYDLSNSIYNKLTLSLEGKYNGYTSHSYLPYIVFDYWEVKSEFRKYWRTDFRSNSGTKPTFFQNLFSRHREKPRYWRAYYLGGYLNTGAYDFKFSRNGTTGKFFGAGISAGYSLPLYSYKKGNIDIELGGSVGLMMTQNNKFTLDRENNLYIPTSEVSSWHILPYPVISDIRLAFVFRNRSIKDKYKQINYEKIQRRETEKLEKRRVKDSIRVAKHLNDSILTIRKKFVKDSINQARQYKDSVEKSRKKSRLEAYLIRKENW